MATKFQADITQQLTPSTPDPSTVARAYELKAKAAGNLISAVGTTVFDALKGYEEKGIELKQQREVDTLQSEMNYVKSVDIQQKLEQSTFTKDTANPILDDFKKRQQALVEARDQLPQRQKEMMLRAEANLKNAIAKYPGMSDTFRQISGKVTGKSGLELYSVNNLYDEIGSIEKINEQKAKAAAKADDDTRKAFVKDVSPLVGETVALTMYDQLSPNKRVEYAGETVATANAKAEFERNMKIGGTALVNGVSATRLAFTSKISNMQIIATEQLTKMGISRADLATGNVSPEVLEKPEIKQLLNDQGSTILKELDVSYQYAMKELQAKMGNPVDAESARTAISDLDAWYKSQRDFFSTKGVYASLLASNVNGAGLETFQKRLAVIKSLNDIAGIPEDVAANLMSFGDTVSLKKAQQRYPTWAKHMEFINKLMGGARQGISEPSFMQLVKDKDKIEASGGMVPTTPSEGAASMISHQTSKSELAKFAAPGAPLPPQAAEMVNKYVTQTIFDPANTDATLRDGGTLLSNAMTKFPKSEQENIKETTKNTFNRAVYMFGGSGMEAQTRLETVKKEKPNLQITIDPVTMQATAINPTPAKAQAIITRGGVSFKPPASEPHEVAKTNAALKSVDNAIRVRAIITGETVADLRKEFLSHFSSGKPLADSFANVTAAPTASGVSLGGAQPLTGVLKKEKEAITAMGVARQDLTDHIVGLKRTLEDTKPGSPTHTRISNDIAMAEKELKGAK